MIFKKKNSFHTTWRTILLLDIHTDAKVQKIHGVSPGRMETRKSISLEYIFVTKKDTFASLFLYHHAGKKVTRILRDVNTIVSSQLKRPGPVEQLFTTILYPALFYSECVGKQKAIHQRDRLDYYQTKKNTFNY